jgi:hypothetical protein
MPRPRGRQSRDSSIIVATRTPLAIAQRLYTDAGLQLLFTEDGKPVPGGSQLAEHVRNVFRHSLGIPLDKKAGYEEGKMQGWAESQTQMRSALSGFYRGEG